MTDEDRFASPWLAVLLVALALGVVGCSQGRCSEVNGEVITIEELHKQVEQLKKQYPQMFEGADGEGRLLDFKQRLLDNLINQKLLEQAAEEKGIEVTDADVQAQIDQLKAGFKDDDQFTRAAERRDDRGVARGSRSASSS